MMLVWAMFRPRVITSPLLLAKIFEDITRGSVDGVRLTVHALVWIEMSVVTSSLNALAFAPVKVRMPEFPSASTTEVS